MWMSLNKMKVFIAPAFLLFLFLAQRFEMVSTQYFENSFAVFKNSFALEKWSFKTVYFTRSRLLKVKCYYLSAWPYLAFSNHPVPLRAMLILSVF